MLYSSTKTFPHNCAWKKIFFQKIWLLLLFCAKWRERTPIWAPAAPKPRGGGDIFCAVQNGRCVSLLHDIKKLRRMRNGKLHHARHFPFSVLLSGKMKKSLAFLSSFFDILRKPFLFFATQQGVMGRMFWNVEIRDFVLRGQSSLSDPRGQTRAQQQPLSPMRADKKIRTFHFKFVNLCLLR